VDRHNGKGARVKRSVTVAAAATAIVVVGLSGCSSNKSSTSSGGSSAPSAAAGSTGGTAAAKVTVDGKDQNVQGTVVCSTVAGDFSIAIGGQASGVAAVLTTADPPAVKSVGLGTVGGVVLGYAQGSPQGNASATKDGNKYKITGTASGADTANPMAGMVTKPFEIDVTCP
jgi:ipoprotein LpqH